MHINNIISYIILAAGESKRFGELKQIYKIKNQSFLKIILQNLYKLSFPSEIIIGVGCQKDKIISELQDSIKPLKIVVNKNYKNGQLSTFQECLRKTDPDSDGYMMILSDHPFVQFSTYEKLIKKFYNNNLKGIFIPQFKKRKGHPVLFAKTFKNDLLNAPLDKGARAVVHNNYSSVHLVTVPDPYILADIDNKEILKKYLKNL